LFTYFNPIVEIFNNLESLSINNTSISTYSSLDKVTINTELCTTFGKDIYGKQVSSIITKFLGYESYSSFNDMFMRFVKRCNKAINDSNNSANTKSAIILQSIYDLNESFISTAFLSQLEQLTKSYYVAFGVISYQEETLGEAISRIAKGLKG